MSPFKRKPKIYLKKNKILQKHFSMSILSEIKRCLFARKCIAFTWQIKKTVFQCKYASVNLNNIFLTFYFGFNNVDKQDSSRMTMQPSDDVRAMSLIDDVYTPNAKRNKCLRKLSSGWIKTGVLNVYLDAKTNLKHAHVDRDFLRR